MKFYLRIIAIFLVSSVVLSSIDKEWGIYKSSHAKKFKDSSDESIRKSIFRSNLERINEFNAQNHGYKLGVNQFADETIEEAIRKHTGLKRRTEGQLSALRSRVREITEKSAASLPASYGKLLFLTMVLKKLIC
jgi:hypothetical protein